MISAVFAAAVWVELVASLDAIRALAATHGGRELHATHDGVALEFASAVAAVRCAAEAQREAEGALQIGIDAGEGDPSIVAEQLCRIAEPGEILVSSVVEAIAGVPSQPARRRSSSAAPAWSPSACCGGRRSRTPRHGRSRGRESPTTSGCCGPAFA